MKNSFILTSTLMLAVTSFLIVMIPETVQSRGKFATPVVHWRIQTVQPAPSPQAPAELVPTNTATPGVMPIAVPFFTDTPAFIHISPYQTPSIVPPTATLLPSSTSTPVPSSTPVPATQIPVPTQTRIILPTLPFPLTPIFFATPARSLYP